MTRRYRIPTSLEAKNPMVYLFYAVIDRALSDVESVVKKRWYRLGYRYEGKRYLHPYLYSPRVRFLFLDAILFLTNTIDDWVIKYADALSNVDIGLLKEMIMNKLNELGLSHIVPLSFDDFHRLMTSEANLNQLLHPGD